jgi:AraC family transcriptional regulator
MHEVSLSDEPERRVVGLAHRGAYGAIGATFERLFGAIGALGLEPEIIEMLAVYRDDPRMVPEAELRSLAGIRVRGDLPLSEGLSELRLPGGRHARVEVKGPYSGLPAAWEWAYADWLPASGERDRGTPSFEIYANDPREVPPEEILTLIYLPLA